MKACLKNMINCVKKMKQFSKKISFHWPDKISIDGKAADLTSHSRSSTAYQRAPFLTGHEIRLFLPFILLPPLGGISIRAFNCGPNWTEKTRSAYSVESCSISDDINKLLDDVICLQTGEKVHSQMLRQAELFKEKSDIFSPYNICPPVGDLIEIKNAESAKIWPQIQNRHETIVQMSAQYIEKFGSIWGLEVKNANLLPPGSWETKDNKKYNKFLKDEYYDKPGAQLETRGSSASSNFINGYYIDWDIYCLDIEALQK